MSKGQTRSGKRHILDVFAFLDMPCLNSAYGLQSTYKAPSSKWGDELLAIKEAIRLWLIDEKWDTDFISQMMNDFEADFASEEAILILGRVFKCRIMLYTYSRQAVFQTNAKKKNVILLCHV